MTLQILEFKIHIELRHYQPCFVEQDVNILILYVLLLIIALNEVYKVKDTQSGGSKVILRDDTFDPPIQEMVGQYEKIERLFPFSSIMIGINKNCSLNICDGKIFFFSKYLKIFFLLNDTPKFK